MPEVRRQMAEVREHMIRVQAQRKGLTNRTEGADLSSAICHLHHGVSANERNHSDQYNRQR